MKAVGLVAVLAFLVGACGAQELAFDAVEGGGPEAGPETGADGASSQAGCSSDSDCKLASLHCDPYPSSGQCFACVLDDQCTTPEHPVCDSSGLHLCVECNGAKDCPGGVCEPTTHRCVLSCADGGVCPDNYFYCRAGLCLGCTNDRDCTSSHSGPRCNTAIGQCVECVTEADCPRDRLCNPTTGRCVECLTSRNCYPGEVCDPTIHACVDTGGSPYEGGVYGPTDSSPDAYRR